MLPPQGNGGIITEKRLKVKEKKALRQARGRQINMINFGITDPRSFLAETNRGDKCI
jgi:hypothetical protein